MFKNEDMADNEKVDVKSILEHAEVTENGIEHSIVFQFFFDSIEKTKIVSSSSDSLFASFAVANLPASNTINEDQQDDVDLDFWATLMPEEAVQKKIYIKINDK